MDPKIQEPHGAKHFRRRRHDHSWHEEGVRSWEMLVDQSFDNLLERIALRIGAIERSHWKALASRKFKCTTIPIFRKDYGLIGAICINIDVNFITDEVMKSEESLHRFFKNYCKTDMVLEENILSKEEFDKAQKGKRYWKQAV